MDAEEALRAIGADALPFLVRDLQRADRNPTTRSICEWLAQADRISPMRRHWYGWVNAPAQRRITAERAFYLLGRVCPGEIVRLLEHPNPKVREVAAASLALEHAFGPDGPYMTPALEQHWRAYRDGVGLMRATALAGLSRAALHVPNFESLCVAAATDPDHRVRVSAMRAFAECPLFEPDYFTRKPFSPPDRCTARWPEFVRVMAETLADADAEVRCAARDALLRWYTRDAQRLMAAVRTIFAECDAIVRREVTAVFPDLRD